MALPPSIPTSFVPKQPVETNAHKTREGTSIFLTVGFVIAGFALLVSGAVFGYEKYLENVKTAKDAELQKEESSININTVNGFIRLRNRLLAANTLLNQHVAASQFFDLLESVTLQNVHFGSLKLSVAEDRTATIEMGGTAKSFNALAAESSAFAADTRIKRAIFAQIKANANGTVNFVVSAQIDRGVLLSQMPAAGASLPQTEASAPQAPETAATTSSSQETALPTSL